MVEQNACDGFENGVGVMDSCIAQREGVDHRVQRKWLQSTCHRGSPSSNDSPVCEAIDLCQDDVDCYCVLWLLCVEGSGHETDWVGVVLTVV